MIKRALLSVSNKKGLLEFAKFLQENEVELIGTSGTVRYLTENGIKIRDIAEITGIPPIIDGRVKTLHYQIAAALLFKRNNPKHIEEIKKYGIKPIDMVVANLYPFKKTVEEGKDWETLLENIDIGGVTLIRAAAKNYQDVVIIVSPSDYRAIMKELKNRKEISIETRKFLAGKAFTHTASYDSYISKVFNSSPFPKTIVESYEKLQDLRYGINPHQRAAIYIPQTEKVSWRFIAGDKGISYNNLLDLQTILTAFELFKEENMALIVKHTNPCGLATGKTALEAYRKALSADAESAFGGVIGINQTVDIELAKELTSSFKDAVIATAYTEDAIELIHSRKKRLSIIELKVDSKPFISYRKFKDYMIAQEEYFSIIDKEKLKVITEKSPTEQQWEELMFAWKVVSLLNSNAVVVTKDHITKGIGCGNVNRARATEYALRQANESANGAVLASDGFFPFSDSIKLAADYGISAIIQPGGSIRDNEVIEEANKHGIVMVFTGIRTFKH